jgi:hypothetical protein
MMDDLTRRAFAAYFRSEDDGDQPNSGLSGPVEHQGKTYVVLYSGRSRDAAPLAVYRVRTSGQLKRLRRWPAEVAER